ncbi:MAG TPA: isocitrate/isopropylmalate dehydrogenase family protein [Thermomicrobiales bacterium]|nr:isocitrate/isopropylmalate dehydrogenase family protein [Thermomicrobiales bacterium]
MATYQVTLIPGDGIGPEVAAATRTVLDATGIGFDWDVQQAGSDALDETGELLPEATLESIRRNGIGLKGPITTPVGSGFRSVNVGLRQALELYANLRPGRTIKGVQSTFDDIDLVVVRENMEDTYAGVEFDTGTDSAAEVIEAINARSEKKIAANAAISIKMITPEGSRRIVEYAFEYARKNGRKLVTAVHKANIMKYSDGLFLHVAQEVAKEYPDIEFNDRIVDNMCMQLMQKPELYDVLVMPNLYGDIVSDMVAGMVGGLGVAPGGNIGKDAAVFEPIHGSAPSHAGKNEANPVAMILSGALMLRHLGETGAAEAVENAVEKVISEGKSVTYDLRKDRDPSKAASTTEMAEAIVAVL